jgi:hypothetical protein
MLQKWICGLPFPRVPRDFFRTCECESRNMDAQFFPLTRFRPEPRLWMGIQWEKGITTAFLEFP